MILPIGEVMQGYFVLAYFRYDFRCSFVLYLFGCLERTRRYIHAVALLLIRRVGRNDRPLAGREVPSVEVL